MVTSLTKFCLPKVYHRQQRRVPVSVHQRVRRNRIHVKSAQLRLAKKVHHPKVVSRQQR